MYMVSQKHPSVHGVPETLQCTLCPRTTPVYMVSQKHSSVHCVPETLQCTLCPRNKTVFTMLDTNLLRTGSPNNCGIGKRYSSNLILHLLYLAFRALHAHLLYQFLTVAPYVSISLCNNSFTSFVKLDCFNCTIPVTHVP